MRTLDERIKHEYKGFTIRFNEYAEEWALQDDEGNDAYTNTSLKKVKEYIAKIAKKDFKLFDIYHIGRWNDEFNKVTVTSIDEAGDYWIRTSEGRREKIRPTEAVKINEGNDARIEAIKKLKTEISKLNKQEETLIRALGRYGKEEN